MKKDLVTFKGSTKGIQIEIKGDDYGEIIRELDEKINTSSQFFKGAKLNKIDAKELSKDKTLEIKLMLKYKYQFHVDLNLVASQDMTSVSEKHVLEELYEGMTKFVHGTVRSGQVVDYYGNIVIIGDVNPGAFLKAGGNIVVLGSLKGVAQAGCEDNLNAIVAAYSLLPTQLRIGNKIARPPEGYTQNNLPEIARYVNGEVCIEPYLPSK